MSRELTRDTMTQVQDVQHPRWASKVSRVVPDDRLTFFTPTDKPLESVFGYISVLPGAFSAYRYRALLGAPLAAYFLGEKMHEAGNIASLSDSNMYLAEDRILCFELVTKKNENWILKYVKAASASTDVPDTLPEFISQRRRWMNGSFFAALHATTHYYRVLTSGQNFLRKMWMSLIFLYNAIQVSLPSLLRYVTLRFTR